MVCLVCTTKDDISAGITAEVVGRLGLTVKVDGKRYRQLGNGKVDMLQFNEGLIDIDDLDKLISTDLFVFLSQHRSASGKISMTVHPTGNWSGEAEFGGRPKELSTSDPEAMLGLLMSLKRNNNTDTTVVYEATHHGPLVRTPSLFFEVGGPLGPIDHKFYGIMANSLVEWLGADPTGCDKVAFGIGAGHYPEKFTALSLESKYGFTHFMPKYQCGNVDMVEQGIARSTKRAECALIDWKGIKSDERSAIIKRLGELGVDYVRI